MIWGSNRSKFGTPEADYKDKKICVTGKITGKYIVPPSTVQQTEAELGEGPKLK